MTNFKMKFSGVFLAIVTLMLMDKINSLAANPHQEMDKWTMQLIELKMMVSSLDSKFSALDSKVSNFHVLEYAFKMNSVDSHLRNIDYKMNQMEGQLKSIKENSEKSACPEWKQIETNVQEPRSSSQRVTGKKLMENFEEKFDDYMSKTTKFLQGLDEQIQEQRTTQNRIQETVRTGLTKIYEKMEKVMAIEGHVSRMTQIVTGLPTRVSQLSDQLFEMTKEIGTIKASVEKIEENKANETISGDHSNFNVPGISDLATYALKLGDELKIQVSTLNYLNRDIDLAQTTAKHINDNKATNVSNETFDQILPLLMSNLNRLSNKSTTLFPSVSYMFNNIYNVLLDMNLMLNKTTSCGYTRMFNIEFQKLSKALDTRCTSESTPVDNSLNMTMVLPPDQVKYLRHCVTNHLESFGKSGAQKSKTLGEIFG